MSYLERYRAGIASIGLVTVLITPEPDTDCDTCWAAEQDPFMRALRSAFGRHSPSASFLSGIGDVVSVMCGVPVTTWYDRHREDWERTGDLRHLERMLRHV